MKNKITIALIGANRPLELIKCIRSVLNQSYKNFDLIVSDDSIELSDKYRNKISRLVSKKGVFLHNNPAHGEIKNSNITISKAKTEYVCLLHDDDRLEKNFLLKIMSEINKDNDIDLAYTGRTIVDHKDKVIAKHHSEMIGGSILYNAKDILDNFLINKKVEDYSIPINTPGLVFRKNIFTEIGGFSNEIDTHCDTDFLLKALYRSKKVLLINEPLYISKVWYGNSGRTSSSRRGVVWKAQKSVYLNFLKYAKQFNDKNMLSRKEDILTSLAKRSVSINGPLIWIALRYEGNFFSKVNHLTKTYKEIKEFKLGLVENLKLSFLYIATILIPQFVWLLLLKMFLRKFNEKH